MINTAGKYVARAVKVELGETQDGKPQIVASFRISEGPDAGQEVTWFGYLFGSDAEKEAKNQARCVESLRYMGFQGDDLDNVEQQILDNEVEIVVEMKPGFKDPSRSFPSVRFVNRIGGGFAVKPADAGTRKRLSAELKSIFKSTPAIAPVSDSSPPPASNGAVSGSKEKKNRIPF